MGWQGPEEGEASKEPTLRDMQVGDVITSSLAYSTLMRPEGERLLRLSTLNTSPWLVSSGYNPSLHLRG